MKPIVYFRYKSIYVITPRLAILGSTEPFIIQWIGRDKLIDFNDKESIVGVKVPIKYMFISDAKDHNSPIRGNTLIVPMSLNNIKCVEEPNLQIGDTYQVGERRLVLRGFVNHDFYVSENPHTNDYETYHQVPVDERKQIFRMSIDALKTQLIR